MDNIVQGLFGLTPYQVDQQQNQGLMNYAGNLAQMGAAERGVQGMIQGGGMLAAGAAPAFGLVNPQMQEAQRRESALGGINLSDPNSILDLASRTSDPRTRLQLQLLAQDAQEKRQKESPYAKIDPKDYTPESLAEFSLTRNPAVLKARDATKTPVSVQEYLYAKDEGGYKGSYSDWLKDKAQSIHVNTGNPAPITPVTIQDPGNPNATIVIDGRTRQVLGVGPKLTQAGGAEQILALAKPSAKLRVDSMTQNLDRLDTALSDLDADPGLSHITGTLAGRTPNLTNAATGAQGKLDSIKSQIFQSSLQAMREASKTGGAVGNVSDREGDKLEATLGSLAQAQGTPDFRAQLKKIRAQVKLSKALIANAYDEQFGHIDAYTPPGTPSETGTGLPPAVAAALAKHGAK